MDFGKLGLEANLVGGGGVIGEPGLILHKFDIFINREIGDDVTGLASYGLADPGESEKRYWVALPY